MLPRTPFAHLPTPVEPLTRLTAALGGPEIIVKRDDQTGLAFGGNKTRKLEYLIADAQSRHARTLITGGAVQSNHCRQTAAAAARMGLDCILILTGDPPEAPSGNLLLDQLFGARTVYTTKDRRDETMQAVLAGAEESGKRPYLIPYGGSNAIGAAAYAYAVQELLDQGVAADWIVFASSSGGTHAGLAAGARLFGFDGRVLGISIDEPLDVLTTRVARLATETAALLRQPVEFMPEDILANADYLGGGYGVMGAAEVEAVQMLARLEGLLVDPVYTGRAAAGLIDLVREGYFKAGERVLFWHTGGQPALLASQYAGVVGSVKAD